MKARGPVGNTDPTPAIRSFVVKSPARPAVADFDGNGASDISVFRAGSGSWFPQGGTDAYWGTAGDQPLPLPAAIRQMIGSP